MKAQTPKTEPIRPFCLEYADAENEIFAAINNAMAKHNVPMFLMESILAKAYREVRDGAKNEMQNASVAYQKQLEQYNKEKEE